jgi:hypothetical protein
MLLKIDENGIWDLDRGCYIVWTGLDARLHCLGNKIEKLNEWFVDVCRKYPIDIENDKNRDSSA